MIKLFANIGIGHENDWQTIKGRVVAAAQCNADALVITKSTPDVIIPKHKRYVAMESKWGELPYLEVANKSELDDLNVKKFNDLTNQIGIPVIWCITDIQAGDWVLEHTTCKDIKIHFDSQNDLDLLEFCYNNFEKVRYCGNNENVKLLYNMYPSKTVRREKLFLYHTTIKFPPQVEELKLSRIDELRKLFPDANIGFEGRCEAIYPDCAVALKNINYIEKYLGDEEEFNPAVLSHQKFYDFFVNMNQLEIANG